MMDETCPWTTDKNGDDIWYSNDSMKTKDPEQMLAD